ncbi:MAG: DUF6067 family protein [Kiritimatiellae bacterium]|nr:DUF6067 family protein [Kiritimatiellia bacterium]
MKMKTMFIACLSCLLLPVIAIVGGESPVPRISELDPLMDCVTFYLSFDNSKFEPDFAAGRGVGKLSGNASFVSGVSGQAELIGTGGAAAIFSRTNNFPVTRRGAVSLWVSPQEWDHRNDGNIVFMMTGNASFYLQRQGPLYKSDGQVQRHEALQLLCLSPVTGHAGIMHNCSDWKNGDWHFLVANWQWPVLEFSVDGGPFQAKAVVHMPTEQTFGDLIIGGHTGPKTLLDEVTIYRRPLTETEARLLWRNPRLQRPAPRMNVAQHDSETIAIQFKVYPSLNKIKARADITALSSRTSVTGGVLRVQQVGAEKPVAEQRLIFHDNIAEQLFDTLPLIDGDYTLALSLLGGEGVPKEPVVQKFERRVFAWENNNLGISDKVIPPFTPLKVDGRKISCVLREHTTGDSGLWDQIISQGHPLLTAPMRWEVVVNGKKVTVPGTGWKLESSSETAIIGSAAWREEPSVASVRAEMDYDGMTKFTLTIPDVRDRGIERLTLVIPVRDSEAPYMHACADQLRYNFAGKVPPGEGVVWDSGKAGRTDLIGRFYPYIWVGGGERGLCWFADNDMDWSLDDSTPPLELVRRGDTLELRVHFATKLMPLDWQHQITFGIQATPVKPMPSDWRKWQCSKKLSGTRPFSIVGASFYYGCLSYDFYPASHDLAIYRKMSEARDSGKADMGYVKTWIGQHLVDEKPGSERQEFMSRHVAAGLYAASSAQRREGCRFIPYTNPRGIGFHMAEWPTFQDEWHKFTFFNRAKKGQLDYDITPTKSFQDAALWYYREMMQVFDGIYWDNTFLAANWDTVVGGAWTDNLGRTHPGLGLWAMRELIKRTAIMFYQMGRDGIFVSHMTNASLVPVNAFANVNLDWEWKYGWDDFQDRFTPELTVAETIGRQTGNFPLILSGGVLDRKDPRYPWVMRTRLGVMLVHELRAWDYGPETDMAFYGKLYEFGYGEPDCQVFNYWDAGHPVKIEGVNGRTIVLARGRKALVIITDYGNGGTAKLIVDLNKLRLPSNVTAKDFETGETVSSTVSGEFVFQLKKHDFKAMLIE